MNRCDILLKINNSEIEVTSNIKLKEKTKTSFLLKDSMEIIDASINYEKHLEEVIFLGKCNRYIFESEEDIISVKYRGKPYGFSTECSRDKVMLPIYSVWYPILDNIKIDKVTIKIEGLEDFLVVDAKKKDNFWIIDKEADNKSLEDWNVRAFNKEKVFILNNKSLKIYTGKEEELGYIEKISNEYAKIMKYYTQVLGDKKESSIEIISNGIEYGGGYFRSGFIVMPYLEDTDGFIYSFIGHELGHLWHNGYNTNSYDDWLNETGAEWSSLSFILKNNIEGLYTKQIEKAKEEFKTYPIMKPEDGTRPSTAHSGGVLLFNEIYLKYGLDTVNKLLKTVHDTSPKTTDKFLENVEKNFNKEIFEIIEKPFI